MVITPLSRAIGRDFAAAVLPGGDELRLGTLPNDPGLLDEASRKALGLPDRAVRQRRAAVAFVQLLRLPRVALSCTVVPTAMNCCRSVHGSTGCAWRGCGAALRRRRR